MRRARNDETIKKCAWIVGSYLRYVFEDPKWDPDFLLVITNSTWVELFWVDLVANNCRQFKCLPSLGGKVSFFDRCRLRMLLYFLAYYMKFPGSFPLPGYWRKRSFVREARRLRSINHRVPASKMIIAGIKR
jgi:hypothetical protein